MPLTASQSGLGVVKGLFTDDYRGTSNSTSRSSQHPPHSPQSQTRPFQHQQQQQQHNRQFLPSSTSPSSKHTKVTTATTTTNRGQRGRTHSNTTSVIDPSALQYASKFSNSNNNVTVSTTIAGHANVSGSTNSTMALPQGALPQGALQQLHSHHHSSTNTYAPSNSSTTTTFYSGVKLAPPVLSASVEQLGRRASDQKIWYTIQVCPCDLTIITPAVQASASSSTNGAATGVSGACSGGTGVTSIPRKPYKIYRRYEDVADFADQLEEEFTGKVVVPSTLICLQQDTKDSNTAAPITTSTSGVVSSGGYCINVYIIGFGE
ncbi:hypothetical protein BGZ95_008912 [Linnemannia exigua]|uniref:Uncharacterized protein n=1 Tax=Linnemannia exigua TaxID=604196 RepID=A0AAD4DDJ6_9FUNG|nr:hypothetical protein BGZ95_008912 [Linnemannia exigua]